MDRKVEMLNYPAPAASHVRRRQVRRLLLTARLVDVGDLEMDLDPIEILADLDAGFLPAHEGSWTAA